MTPDQPARSDAWWHIDDAPMGVMALTDEGRILQVNQLLCGWLGQSAQRLEGGMVDAVFTPASRLLYHTYLLPLLKLHGQVAELSLALLSADGNRLDAMVCAQRLSPQGGPGVVRFAFTLMRERRKLEDQLRSAQRMAELVPGLLFEWCERPGQPPSLSYASEGLRDLFGLSPQDALRDASPVIQAIHPEDRPWLQRELADAAQALRSWRGTYRVGVGARERWIETHAMPTRSPDGSLLWHGYSSDVTERRRLELQAREREAAEQASQAKSAFLARVSHELRTPLNGILGFTQLLLGPGGVPDPHHRRQLGHVEAAGQTLLRLVDDVLDISRIESDQLRLNVQAVDMVSLLRESVGMLQPVADTRGSRFEGPGLAQAWCLADPHRLRQCLLNLLSNAVKYGPAGGQIDLGVELGSLGLTLRIRDRGPGFSADQLKHLFEPFNRLGAERSTTEGTGLGLLITRKLVESMGGALAVGNADEGGACMSLRLPAAPVPDVLTGTMAQAGARAGRALAGGARTARQVLYVEDNEVNAILMGAVFRLRPHWALHVVSTAAEALAWVARQRPDLFLLDLNLPDLDGFALRARLCAMPGCAEVPMVAVSADALAVHAGRELPQAFDAWWTKPIDVDDVLEQLDAMLDGQDPGAA